MRLRREVAGLSVVATLAFATAGAGAAPSSWQIEDITPDASSYAEATAVNAEGQIVGTFDGRASLWGAGGVTDVSGGRDNTYATDVNATGDVTLWQAGGPPCGQQGYKAFVWRNDEVTELQTLGGTDAVAMGINDDGVIVGASCPSSSVGALRHAVRWVDGVPDDLGGLGDAVASFARAINDDGTVVGYSGLPGTNPRDEQQHAVLWDANGIVDLGVLPGVAEGNENSVAAAINDDGLVVGWSTTSAGPQHAVLWSADPREIVDLGTLDGGSFSRAYGVSDDGVVVGVSTAADGLMHAFAWKDTTGMLDLGGLETTSASAANAVSSTGLIVGGSDGHAVVWRPTADSDGDGVPDSLDVTVTTPPGSVGFSDAVTPDLPALGVGTYGVITPNGLDLSVQDLDPGTASSAVRVAAGAAGSGTLDLAACGEEPVWALGPGDAVSVDCGSVSVAVLAGDGITGRAGTSSIQLAVGTRATFESSGPSLVVRDIDGGPVTLIVDLPLDDAVVTFPTGTGGTLDTTTAAVTGVTGDGVTVAIGGVEVPVSAGPGITLIQGGTRNDTILGTPGDDVIVDAGGNNTVNGRAGNDVIVTAGGNDRIDGGLGHDRIEAGDGSNNVKGGDGDDHISSGRGNDTIDGGKHNDACIPGMGNNNVKNCERTT